VSNACSHLLAPVECMHALPAVDVLTMGAVRIALVDIRLQHAFAESAAVPTNQSLLSFDQLQALRHAAPLHLVAVAVPLLYAPDWLAHIAYAVDGDHVTAHSRAFSLVAVGRLLTRGLLQGGPSLLSSWWRHLWKQGTRSFLLAMSTMPRCRRCHMHARALVCASA
jgi:hypothetical protein